MLKEFLVLAITAFCLGQAMTAEHHTADMDFLHKQRRIYDLYMYVDQTKLVGSDWYEVGRSFDFEANFEFFTDKMVVKEFLYRYKLGMLNRNALFSVYNKEHASELRMLFRLFYSAKDFQTFYKTACWARLYLNRGCFITALTTAVMYRPDCKYIVLPPMYEVYPHLFFGNEYIQEAHRYKMSGAYAKKSGAEFAESYLIDYSNYTSFADDYFTDFFKLDYFTKDIGLNNYYYYIRNMFPFWITMKDLELPAKFRGELYYYVHQQILARYYLERLSNGYGDIEEFDFYKTVVPGYFSTLVYGNGVPVPSRDYHYTFPSYKGKYIKEIENFESRILAAIDSGFLYDREGKQISLYSPEGFNYLGNLIEGNYDSCNYRYYGAIETLYRNLFGYNYQCKSKQCFVPSVLQTYTAALRDPAFYQLYKKIIGFFYRFKTNLPVYTREQLEFNGVAIKDVKVDKLYTFMETFDTFINNAVTVDNYKDGQYFNIKARSYRLNYKPFTYTIDVKSEVATKGMIRIFMGPSFAEEYYKIEDFMYYNWYKFVELDQFIVDLKVGMNEIERLSTDSAFVAKDWQGSDYFYKKLLKAIEGNEPFTYTDKVFGFPNNLYLPKGRVGGMPYKLFVFISPFDESKTTSFTLPMFGKYYYDGKSFGYPLDRPMYPYFFNLSNVFFKDINIYFGKDYPQEHYSYGYQRYQQYKQYHYRDAPVEHSSYQKYEGKEFKPYYHMDYDKTIY